MGGRVIVWNVNSSWRRLFQQSTPDIMADQLWPLTRLDCNTSGPITDPQK